MYLGSSFACNYKVVISFMLGTSMLKTPSAARYPNAAIVKGITYPSNGALLNANPIPNEAMAAPVVLVVLPIPTTEPTTFFGKISDTSVKTFAAHPQCPAAAIARIKIANQKLLTWVINATGSTIKAHINIVVFRALFRLQPFFKNQEDKPPKKIPPTSAVAYMAMKGIEMEAISMPNFLLRNFAPQNR